jgi:uncharacterized membrane protein
MTKSAHLWAIGYENKEKADQVRKEVEQLGWAQGQVGKYLILLDLCVVVRHLDGSFEIDHKPFPHVANLLGCAAAGFLAGLVVAAPLTGAALGALLGGAGDAALANLQIDKNFIHEVQAVMKPGSSALFVLDDAADMEVIPTWIRGLGGVVLKTNVDLKRAKLIQSSLAASTESV